jgi:hypothetical protein
MKKIYKMLIALALVLSLSLLASCGDDDEKDPHYPENPFEGGIEGPIVDW